MNRRPVPMSPAMQQEIQRRLAAGEPLPPGVHAVPEGQVPPPHTYPTGVAVQPDGRPIQPPEDLTELNPMTINADTITLLRNASECPLPSENTIIQQNLQIMSRMGKVDDSRIEQTMAQGLATYLRANIYCENQMKKRTVVRFEDDEELAELHAEIQEGTKKLEKMRKEFNEIVTKVQAAGKERWERSVRKYGLDPAKNIYILSSDDADISQAHLDCAACKGKVRIRKARQATTELIQEVQRELKDEAAKKKE